MTKFTYYKQNAVVFGSVSFNLQIELLKLHCNDNRIDNEIVRSQKFV